MEYQIPLARGNSGFCLRSKFAVVRLHSTGPISRGRWSSAGALRRRFAAVRFCLASPDMPLRPRWRGKSSVRTRCRVQFPGAAPICPVSIAGDAAVLYTDDTAFDLPTAYSVIHCKEVPPSLSGCIRRFMPAPRYRSPKAPRSAHSYRVCLEQIFLF